jgi:hypothetical protein
LERIDNGVAVFFVVDPFLIERESKKNVKDLLIVT